MKTDEPRWAPWMCNHMGCTESWVRERFCERHYWADVVYAYRRDTGWPTRKIRRVSAPRHSPSEVRP